MTVAVTLPRLTVEVAGAPLREEHGRALATMRVQQRLSAPALCELTFVDPPGPLTASDRLTPGTELRVLAEEHDLPLFDGEVTAVEFVYGPSHGREIRVRAYDALHRLRKRQTVRAHVEVTPLELARELVRDLGLSVEAAAPGPVWQHLIQHRQSDLDLLLDVMAKSGLYTTLRGRVLHLLTLEGDGDAVLLRQGESLLEARFDVNGDPACRSVSSAGWNPLRGEFNQGSASRPRLGRRVSAEVRPGSVGGSGELFLVDEATADEAHAEAVAQAELDQRSGREVTVWGLAEGDPRLRPGVPIEISGVEDSLGGRHVLTSVNHVVDSEKGFVSEISSYPPPPRSRPTGASVAPGIVETVDDPENSGRVRVRLPTFEDVETDWMGVVIPAAGAGKGLIALPDVGDQVVVIFTHEDPGRGVVLGGLYGSERPPDPGVEHGTVRRYSFLTPGGQKVVLDDEEEKVRLENSDGSYIEMAPKKVLLHAATDLDIEAPGRSIVVSGKAIDFKKG